MDQEGIANKSNHSALKSVLSIWISLILIAVAGTVVVGGVTRLTNSGLSITEWQPIMGAFPPLTEQAWNETFDKYKQTTEFAVEHSHMQLNDFKFIFFWEWLHRNLGRFVGLLVLLPLMFIFGRIEKKLRTRMLIGAALVGLQGALGWFMVKSGLADRIDVSHYRLAAHLILAFFIFSHFQRLLMDVRNDFAEPEEVTPEIRKLILFVHGFLGLQIVYGAFVAGLRAGYLYNTYPKMGEDWVPPGAFETGGIWFSLFENPISIQFLHRWMAIMLLIFALLLPYFFRKWGAKNLIKDADLFLGIVLLQAGLGIATLVLKMPTAIAALHQLGGLIAFASMTVLMHKSKNKITENIKRGLNETKSNQKLASGGHYGRMGVSN